jgi:hypothetical protein
MHCNLLSGDSSGRQDMNSDLLLLSLEGSPACVAIAR